jgi:T5SS/PEP-CTERM-associated repeat protein
MFNKENKSETWENRPTCGSTIQGIIFAVMLVVTPISILFSGHSSQAATKTWTGTTNSDWGTGTNWSAAGAPASADTANINLTAGPLVSTTTAVATTVSVGNTANGSLTISGGGVLTDTSGFIGVSSGIAGTTTVSGAESSWTNSSSIIVGNSGVGTLNIQSGGAVSSVGGTFGSVAGSTGTATVDGVGSSWTDTGSLTIGSSGNGALTISASGTVSNTSSATIAAALGSTGTATVTGAGSSWSETGLTVGNNGTGTLTISDGGAVSNNGHNTLIATATGSHGTVSVTGNGSSWSGSPFLTVGNSGTGSLTISDHALVSSTIDIAVGGNNGGSGSLTVNSAGVLSGNQGYVGAQAGSNGSATLTGSGSNWSLTDIFSDGDSGTGSLAVSNGATMSDLIGFIAKNKTATGTATIDGSGTSFINSGDLYVGRSGVGTLTISNGATVSTGSGQSYSYYDDAPTPAATTTRVSTSTVYIATNAGSTGTLNIGVAAGSPAAAPGTLTASTVAFGAGTGLLVFNHTSPYYVFTPAITGCGTIEVLAGNTILAGDMSGFCGTYNVQAGGMGITSLASLEASVQTLAADQRAAAVESRAVATELLGMTRPVDNRRFVQYGAMFGSAALYAGGQYADRGVTVLGGLAYGSEDYRDIRQSDAPTVAAAMRYTFNDPFGDKGDALHPYAEIGGWITPQATLTLNRTYMNGSDPVIGQGSSSATSWADYGRGGLIWQPGRDDQLAGYGELGQQFISFGGYAENAAGNPFPASVGGGLFRMGVARAGGLWTHDLAAWAGAPISFTLAGAIARSFAVRPGLTATLPGIGAIAAPDGADTWGEFGGRLETRLAEQLALDLDFSGTTGGGALGTVLHGGVGVTFEF